MTPFHDDQRVVTEAYRDSASTLPDERLITRPLISESNSSSLGVSNDENSALVGFLTLNEGQLDTQR
jgi:hypothetical protein